MEGSDFIIFDRIVSGFFQAFWYVKGLCLDIGVLIGNFCDVPNGLRLVLLWVCHVDCLWVFCLLFLLGEVYQVLLGFFISRGVP